MGTASLLFAFLVGVLDFDLRFESVVYDRGLECIYCFNHVLFLTDWLGQVWCFDRPRYFSWPFTFYIVLLAFHHCRWIVSFLSRGFLQQKSLRCWFVSFLQSCMSLLRSSVMLCSVILSKSIMSLCKNITQQWTCNHIRKALHSCLRVLGLEGIHGHYVELLIDSVRTMSKSLIRQLLLDKDLWMLPKVYKIKVNEVDRPK